MSIAWVPAGASCFERNRMGTGSPWGPASTGDWDERTSASLQGKISPAQPCLCACQPTQNIEGAPLVTPFVCPNPGHVYKSNSRERIFTPHTSKILPLELFRIHLLLVMGRSSAEVKGHPGAQGPPARGFPRVSKDNKCSLPCLQHLPPLSPHLEYYSANNNSELLGKRDLIAAYTP